MNVICPACSVRYTIPDDKVGGRRARMTCKRCGETIEIDATVKGAPPVVSHHVVSEPGREPPPQSEWNVAQPSGKRERLTTSSLLDRYAMNTLEPGSLVWREGMTNWLPPYDVPELAEALATHGLAVPGADLFSSDEATRTFDARSLGVASLALGVPGWREPGRDRQSSWNDTTRALDEADVAALQRQAMPTVSGEEGSGDEVTRAVDTRQFLDALGIADLEAARQRQAPVRAPGAPAPSSPQSSLAAQTSFTPPSSPGALPAWPRASRDSSRPEDATRVFDARAALQAAAAEEDRTLAFDARAALEAATKTSDDESTRVFDARAALAAASAEEEDRTRIFESKPLTPSDVHASAGRLAPPPAPRPPPSRRPTPPISAQPTPAQPTPAQAYPTPVAPTAPRPAPAPLPAPVPPPAALEPAHRAPAPLPRPGVSAAGAPVAPAPAPAAFPSALAPSPPPPSARATPRPAAGVVITEQPPILHAGPATSLDPTRLSHRPNVALSEPVLRRSRRPLWIVLLLVLAAAALAAWSYLESRRSTALAAPPTVSTPFDANAAGVALAEAAATATRCKVADGPTGPGRVHVKYVPSGRAESARVSLPYDGTDVGECLVDVFRNTRVPAFAGDPLIVGKNFDIR